MRSRVPRSLLVQVAEDEFGRETGPLLDALVWCLTAEQACAMVDLTRQRPWRLRHAFICRIVADVAA